MRRQKGELNTAGHEEGIWADEQGIGPLACKGRESCVKLVDCAGATDLDFESQGVGCRFYVCRCGLEIGIGWIDEHSNTNGSGYQLTQKLQPFCRDLADEKIYAS